MRGLAGPLLFSIACSAPPSRHPTTMEGVPPPPPEERQSILVPENGVTTLVVDGTALCTADDPTLLQVWGTQDALKIIGKKQGRTVLHVARPHKARVDLDVQIAPARRDVVAVGVGETFVLPSDGVKEYSDSGPGLYDISVSSDGQRLLLIGRRAGTASLLFVFTDGHTETIEITVVYGERQL